MIAVACYFFEQHPRNFPSADGQQNPVSFNLAHLTLSSHLVDSEFDLDVFTGRLELDASEDLVEFVFSAMDVVTLKPGRVLIQ